MSHTEMCPVCQGTGRVQENGLSGTEIIEVDCHGCNGRGWVVPKEYVYNRY